MTMADHRCGIIAALVPLYTGVRLSSRTTNRPTSGNKTRPLMVPRPRHGSFLRLPLTISAPPRHNLTSLCKLRREMYVTLLIGDLRAYQTPLAYVCPHPGCGRAFSIQSNMRHHARVHDTSCTEGGDSCWDTVSIFGKAMGVLALQLKTLATRDVVRNSMAQRPKPQTRGRHPPTLSYRNIRRPPRPDLKSPGVHDRTLH